MRLQDTQDPEGDEEFKHAVLVQGRWLCIVNNPQGEDSAWDPVYTFDVQTLVWEEEGWGALRGQANQHMHTLANQPHPGLL